MVLETHMELCVAEQDFLGKKIRSKIGFFEHLKNLVVNFFLICSIMKV